MRRKLQHAWRAVVIAGCLIVAATGCQTAYYGAMEKVGVHKRDILSSRVQEARNSQDAAKDEFQSAFEEFSSLVRVEGGDLQAQYNKLNRAFTRSEARAKEVSNRIAAVEAVSHALFKEWKQELGQYTSSALRRSSEQQLKETQQRYEQLMTAMRKAEASMKPVLDAFRDQVLFLKHNLNARAIASLEDEVQSVESNVADLIQDMERSIQEADRFIQSMATLSS